MKAGKVKKQSSRNSRTNLSHTLEEKRPNQLTIIQLHAKSTAANILVKLKKSKDTPAVTRE